MIAIHQSILHVRSTCTFKLHATVIQYNYGPRGHYYTTGPDSIVKVEVPGTYDVRNKNSNWPLNGGYTSVCELF